MKSSSASLVGVLVTLASMIIAPSALASAAIQPASVFVEKHTLNVEECVSGFQRADVRSHQCTILTAGAPGGEVTVIKADQVTFSRSECEAHVRTFPGGYRILVLKAPHPRFPQQSSIEARSCLELLDRTQGVNGKVLRVVTAVTNE